MTAAGSCSATFRSKSSNDMQRSERLQSTNSTLAPAARVASGEAMKVFDGQSTVLPRSSKNSSAASAAPVQLEVATDGSPFHAVQESSNAFTSGPSDQTSSSRMPSQSACRRSRSR
jgi:hypothetical protein